MLQLAENHVVPRSRAPEAQNSCRAAGAGGRCAPPDPLARFAKGLARKLARPLALPGRGPALRQLRYVCRFRGSNLGTRGSYMAPRSALLSALRSEEHTSELQSQSNLVCRLLLEKKKQEINNAHTEERTSNL